MPLPNTISDLWRMVYDYKASAVVMLNVMNNNNEVGPSIAYPINISDM